MRLNDWCRSVNNMHETIRFLASAFIRTLPKNVCNYRDYHCTAFRNYLSKGIYVSVNWDRLLVLFSPYDNWLYFIDTVKSGVKSGHKKLPISRSTRKYQNCWWNTQHRWTRRFIPTWKKFLEAFLSQGRPTSWNLWPNNFFYTITQYLHRYRLNSHSKMEICCIFFPFVLIICPRRASSKRAHHLIV